MEGIHKRQRKPRGMSRTKLFLVAVMVFGALTFSVGLFFAKRVIDVATQSRFDLHEQSRPVPRANRDALAASKSTAQCRRPEPTPGDLPYSKAVEEQVVLLHERPSSPVQVAHVVSLITCKKESRVKGFLDSLVILRHSIHQNSIHNLASGSNYSYQMYALIHQDGGCAAHVDLVQRLGYVPIMKDTPVNVTTIHGTWYRTHVHLENCCGAREFIKLYAYTLASHAIVVHWDLDVAVLQPLDDLYDAMLFDERALIGREARARLQIQRPWHQQLPPRIDAFFTRDVTSSEPDERIQAVQGGFLVARPSLQHFSVYLELIQAGNYIGGRGMGSGWHGMGYGGFQGAMAYQGVLAFFYDQLYPNHHVELDACVWNQVVADVIWRGPHKMHYQHQCRDFPVDDCNHSRNTPENGKCRDCRVVPVEQTKTVHYTACKKPWECQVPHPRVPRDKRKAYRLQHLTNTTTCGLLVKKYFEYRRDIEDRISRATNTTIPPAAGVHEPETFLGYCRRQGDYLQMELPAQFTMKQVYGF